MSTAAQQARRKIAQPKSRFNRSTTPTTAPSAPLGQQQSQPATGGSLFSFGNNASVSQSFPPTQQPQQFQFSVPDTSSTFSFGSTNGNSHAFSNPFANVNGTSSHEGQQNESNMMQVSPQKPQTSTNMFGAASSQPAPTTNGFSGFSFGQPAQSQPSKETASSSFSFGQPTSQEPETKTDGFGTGFSFGNNTNSTSSSPSLFGQSASSTSPAFGGFGQSTTNAESIPALAPTFKFGQTSAVPDASELQKEETPKAKPTFGFGQTTSFGQPAPEAAPATAPSKPAFSFGQSTVAPKETEAAPTPSKAPLFNFGQPASQSEPASVPAKKSTFQFGQTTVSSTQPTSSNLFDPPAKSDTSSNSLFGRVTPSDNTPEPTPDPASNQHAATAAVPKNPFASLFGSKPASDTSPGSDKPKPTFQFGQNTTFASPSESPEPAHTQPNLFSSQSADQPVQNNMAPNFFSAPPKSSGGLFSPTPSSTSKPTSNLFDLNKSPSEANSKETESASVQAPTPSTSFFGSKPSTLNSDVGSTPFKNMSQTNHSSQSVDWTDDTSRPAKKRLFNGSSAPESMAKSAGISFGDPAPPISSQATHPKPTSTQTPSLPKESVNRAVSTEGPPQIPRFLAADKYKSYDENWRLKGLNRRFQKVISERNPDSYDLLNLVQNYLDHREAIGAPGLQGHERPKLDAAGTKRKTSDVDDMQKDDQQSKKSRPESSQQTQSITSNNLFASVASPKPATAFWPSKPSDNSTSNLFKSMIPGATSAHTTGFTPSAPKSTTPPASPPKSHAKPLPRFEVPKFGSDNTTGFANSFAQAAAANTQKAEKEAKEKRKAEEFDSEEDDEEAWNKKYEEEQRAKRAKIEAAARGGLKAGFVPSASSSRSNSPFTFGQPLHPSIETDSHPPSGLSHEAAISIDSDEERTGSGTGDATGESGNSGDDEEEQPQDDLPDDEVEDDQDDEALEIPDLAPENSLFGRIEKPSPVTTEQSIFGSSTNNSFKPGVMFGNIGKSTPDAPSFSPFTPAAAGPKGDFVPTTTFNFTPTPAVSSTPAFGSTIRDGPIPGEGLFGSRPTTPQPPTTSETRPANPFGSGFGTSITSAASDNTWTKGSPIKFGNDKENTAPLVEVTAATPPAKDQSKPFAGLFGSATSSAATNPPIKNGTFTGFNFGGPKPAASNSSAPAPGFLSATPHLTAGNLATNDSSRATSPGMTSEAESVATDNTEDYSQDPQTSLMVSNAGEENEDILYESRASLSRHYKSTDLPEKTKLQEGWNKCGSGTVKLLKDRDSGKTRIVFRAEPGANILLNTRLIKGAKYSAAAAGKNGAVTFPVASGDGKMQMWMVKVKTVVDGENMAGIMEGNKAN